MDNLNRTIININDSMESVDWEQLAKTLEEVDVEALNTAIEDLDTEELTEALKNLNDASDTLRELSRKLVSITTIFSK